MRAKYYKPIRMKSARQLQLEEEICRTERRRTQRLPALRNLTGAPAADPEVRHAQRVLGVI